MIDTPKLYPLLPIRNTVLFPGISSSFLISRPGSIEALKAAERDGGFMVVVTQRHTNEEEPKEADLYKTGTLVKIERSAGDARRGYRTVVRGISRFRLETVVDADQMLSTHGELWADRRDGESETIAVLFKTLKELSRQVLDLVPGETEPAVALLDQVEDPGYLTYLCLSYLDLPVEVKQPLLEETSVRSRLMQVLELMQRQRDVLKVQSEVRGKLTQNLGRAQKEALLREQLRAIREELGEGGDQQSDDLRKKIEKAGMPEDARRAADQELSRLEALGPNSPETHVIRTYLDWLCAMPWSASGGKPVAEIDLEEARRILDLDHYGLERIKTRILQSLAVMKLKKQSHGSILCFVGPPGVGKTSLGQSIAKALGRKFVRASLGGMRDDAEIRGHRRTYIGSLPGRIIQGLKKAGENNPVFVLDEIDKLGDGHRGDPAGALLEVLDPEQNRAFSDHYLEVPFDLSNVFFIATCNTLDSIPAPLLDRMEIIELSGYTSAEKFHIARDHLIPKQLEAHGLVAADLEIPDDVLNKVITAYTRESGVRDLQRKVGALCRIASEKIVRAGADRTSVRAELAWLDDAFGNEKSFSELSLEASRPGVVTGLAWTPHGGEILFVEAGSMPGTGQLILTGQLGEVMKESAQIALSLVRGSLAEIGPEYQYSLRDIHIHVPAGAIPKDGPSAGVALFTALASLVSGRGMDPKTAMTGEVTLRGAVLPVGGIREKVIAAHRAGVRRVILSSRNARDLKEVPNEVLRDLKVELVDSVSEVLKLTLGIEARAGSPAYPRSPSVDAGPLAVA